MDNKEFKEEFKSYIKGENPVSILFVSSREYDRFGYREALDELGVKTVAFTSFEPCPEISSVLNGAEALKKNGCDLIVTVGGGSAMDCAKGIKYYLKDDVKILAVPTTAGSGAEVTKTAVLYNNADKESVKDPSLIPEYAVFDHTTLKTLPQFQKISTAFDAFCHSFEAYISKDATAESREYSLESLRLFNKNFNAYINGDETTFEAMMKCSELGGRAINLARTAAPHAFSYKLHKLLGFAHGQACVVCLVYIWKYMANNCGDEKLLNNLKTLEKAAGLTVDELEALIKKLGILPEITMTSAQFEETVNGVNVDRLSNNPMPFSAQDIRNVYSSFIKVV